MERRYVTACTKSWADFLSLGKTGKLPGSVCWLLIVVFLSRLLVMPLAGALWCGEVSRATSRLWTPVALQLQQEWRYVQWSRSVYLYLVSLFSAVCTLSPQVLWSHFCQVSFSLSEWVEMKPRADDEATRRKHFPSSLTVSAWFPNLPWFFTFLSLTNTEFENKMVPSCLYLI